MSLLAGDPRTAKFRSPEVQGFGTSQIHVSGSERDGELTPGNTSESLAIYFRFLEFGMIVTFCR